MKFLNDSKIKIIKTDDGSIGLYNLELDEIYHSRFGAKKEAFEKFIEPTLVFKDKKVDILDICYGIGYNTKTALQYLNINSIDCLELDRVLVENSYKFDFDDKINSIIKENLKKETNIRFFIDDARNSIQKLDKKYDIIFHDGFSPNKQSVLWSEDFISKIALLLKPDGLYCTYNHSKPVLSALKKAKFNIGKTIKEDRTIGIVASYNPSLIQNPLSALELEELNTKSAITYKDKNLNLSHGEIIENRKKEVENSTLITLSFFKKRIGKVIN